eukprot:TRINITY_DN491_c0_g1_i1.p1 TRINITY_DN491_c0_g1~~TRINITY_DN491_c0_g1_i1.p1  ORF type:complete len:188 (+),score=43.78 TRINITY_DN491_c0_g1_i1:55-618(+)
MGIDLRHHHVKRSGRTVPRSNNVYLGLLAKLYKFLARRVAGNNRFNAVIAKRLCMSNINRPPMSIRQLMKLTIGKRDKIAVIVGTVTDDSRIFNIPALKVCALRFTEAARTRIVKNGGTCLTFDQLALQRPKGTNCVLVRGRKNAREAFKHFGPSGVPGSHAKPHVRSKGRKFEKARGRRASRGFKV